MPHEEFKKELSSVVVSRGPCPKCDTSKGLLEYDDGHSHCFSCNTFTPPNKEASYTLDETGTYKMNQSVAMQVVSPGQPKQEGVITELKDRGISKDTCQKYGVRVVMDIDGNVVKHLYPYYNKANQLVSYKVRHVKEKTFEATPVGSLGFGTLFGQETCREKGKYITICEGEIDAMAAYEMMGSKWPVVSIKNGAAAAAKDCKNSYDFLNGFDNIVVCFDMDDPGKKAAQAVAELFEPNKCKIVKLDLKDAGDYIKAGRKEDFVKAWWAASTYTPAGIINLKDFGDALYDETHQQTCLYPWSGLNEKLYGIRTGELVTIVAGTGAGKSSAMRELEHHILKNTDNNIGVVALEENVRQTIFHLMSVESSQRLYIKEVRDTLPREELRAYQEKTVGTGRFFAFDHFGSIGTEEILARVRYMIKALDCKWIFLDHLSILVSGQEGVDERKNIDIIMTKLRSLVEETNCALLLVCHLRRTGADTGHEDGREVSISHLRGSQSIAQLSDAVIALERSQQDPDPVVANTTTVRVLKSRYTGDTGVACHLQYNKATGRLHEVEDLGDALDNPAPGSYDV